jgi:3-hydroxyisobutyrate dehydrogenase-like beta-hydroxyacid dehydrogenase
MPVGFVGLGQMCALMARNLAVRGYDLFVGNRSLHKAATRVKD